MNNESKKVEISKGCLLLTQKRENCAPTRTYRSITKIPHSGESGQRTSVEKIKNTTEDERKDCKEGIGDSLPELGG